MDVDTDRNGTVEAADETGESAWSTTLGAVMYYNIDDDDNNGSEDYIDSAVNGTADAADLARLFVRTYPVPSGGTVEVLVASSAQGRIRIFRSTGGTWTSVYSTGASFTLPAADVGAGDIELGIEANTRISPTWDGYATLTLEIRQSDGTLEGSDGVLLRCAPEILATNLWLPEQMHVVNVGSNNAAFRMTLSSVCASAGVTYVEIPGGSYSNDRWIQDSSEPGIVYLPSTSGRRRVDSVLQLARWRPVDAWCVNALFNPDFDLVRRFSSNNSSMNYGGNLEVFPPHTSPTGTNYPWGRIVTGGGTSAPIGGGTPVTRRMVQAYRDYFNALGVQGPHLEVSTEWLAVGHVDEHTSIVPAPANPRGWAVLLASPQLARDVLQSVADAGGGSLTVFTGRSGWQTTVNGILTNTALTTYNDEVQLRMDAIRSYYMTQLGLADSEIIDLPVLFEDAGSGAAAYNPGDVNMVVIPTAGGTTHLVIPDPEGPDFGMPAVDAWQAEINTRIQALYTTANPVVITYADVFFSYHTLLGEAHCGTNTVRTPPAQDWWDD